MKRAAVIEDLVHERVTVLFGQPPQDHVAAILVVLDEVAHRRGHVTNRSLHPLLADPIHRAAHSGPQQLVLGAEMPQHRLHRGGSPGGDVVQ